MRDAEKFFFFFVGAVGLNSSRLQNARVERFVHFWQFIKHLVRNQFNPKAP